MGIKKKVLFISYDGLTDPLGQSQILPYICGLSPNVDFTILSCEKRDRFAQNNGIISKICTDHGIKWQYSFFRTSPPIVAKYLDLFELKAKAAKLHRQQPFDMVHCRSYIPMDVGMYLKKKFGVKVLFDMRGFWVNERVDGGLWNLKNPVYRLAFAAYKRKEAEYISTADHIVSLTNVAKSEIKTWPSYSDQPISVIPCMVDFSVFSLSPEFDKQDAKRKLGFANEDFVVSYLGSLGTWYLFGEMLDFFKALKAVYTNAKFLFITPEAPAEILSAAKDKGLNPDDFKIYYAKARAEVAEKLKASDISLVFIKKCYSKMASSPTKLGELLALGIPVVCNEGVGDVNEIILGAKGGLLLQGFTEKHYQETIAQIPSVLSYSPEEIRESNKQYYDLPKAIAEYKNIYSTVMQSEEVSSTRAAS